MSTWKVIKRSWILIAVLAIYSCEPSSSERVGLNNMVGLAPPTVPQGCSYDRFLQPTQRMSGSVDLLFVTHTTDSFLSVRGQVVDALDYFVAHIPSDVDLRVAILLAHSGNSSWMGKLYNAPGYPAVLNSQTLSPSDLRADLKYNMTNTVKDASTNGGEEGTNSLFHALDPAKLAASQSLGFFRPDAGLGVMFLANEADICGLPSTDPHTDTDWASENIIRNNTCAGVNTLSVYNKLKAMRAGAPTMIGAAVYTDPAQADVGGTEAEYGWGYMDLVKLAGGMTINLLNGQYSAGMSMAGDLLTQKLNLLTDFTLSQTNVDPASVVVQVDGANASFAYHPATNEVHVDQPGNPGSTVDVIYCPAPISAPAIADPAQCSGILCGLLIGV